MNDIPPASLDALYLQLEKKFESGPDSTVAKTYWKAVRELLTTPGALDQANRHHTFSRLKLMAGKYGEALEKFKKARQHVASGTASGKEEMFYPGPIHIVESLKRKYRFRTIPEIGTDKENFYFFNGEIYERAEEKIKQEADREYIRQWEEMRELAEEEGNKPLAEKLRNCLDHGPSVNDINEVLAMIRRTTFTYDEMNPVTHIPFLNGLLNLKTRQLEPFTPDLFFTYQVNANLLERYVTLKDIPMFAGLLNTAFYEPDIPMVLSYFAYSFHPDLPVHKVLFILGRERIGKGTSVRVLQGLMPKGSGSISLARLLTSERFQFTGIEGKNLLVDSETKRKFKRGTIMEWSAFCNLFGKDVLSVEPKGHEAHDYVSKAKGIFLGNLPFIPVDSPPAVARMLVVQTRDERPRRVIPDLDRKILDAERDLIATLLVQVLFKLMDNDFRFPGEMTDDSTAMVLDQLADPIENFIEEETEPVDGSMTLVNDAYSRFMEWCESKGIPAMSRQTFVKRFGYTFQKKKLGSRGNREYFFVGCELSQTDLDVKSQSQLQVGHGINVQQSPKISLSGERYRRVQHVSHDPSHVGEESDHDHDHACNVRVSGHKLDTGSIDSTEPINKAPANIESVSNLFSPPDSGPNAITLQDAQTALRVIAADGFHAIPAESPVSMDRKSFMISVSKPHSSERERILKDRLAALGFMLRNTGALGPLIFSVAIRGEEP